MHKTLIIILIIIIPGLSTGVSQVIFEKKIGFNEYTEFPSNIITTSGQNYLLSLYSIPVINKNEPFSTLYLIDSTGNIINTNSIIKSDTSTKIQYIRSSFTSNHYIGVGGLKHLDEIYLWIFEFDSNLNIFNEHKIQLPDALSLSRTYIRKSQFEYYIAFEFFKSPYNSPHNMMLNYNPLDNSIITSNWEMGGSFFDFEKNNYDDGFLIAGRLLNKSATTLWEVNHEMELTNQYNDLENDIYHQNDLAWTNNNKLIHAGSYRNPDYETTRFMGIQILDSNMNAQNFKSFGEIGIWNYAGSNESIVVNADNSIYFAGTQGIEYINYPPSNNHIAVHKMDSSLNLDWSYLIGGDAYYITRSISTTFDGGCIITATRYDEALQNQEYDVYLIAMGPDGLDTSIDDPENDDDVVLYPNPGNDMFTIDTKEHHFTFTL
ncbi:MAG: hypothetical protein U5L09_15490 [Bacteroidales bacterium]|nr:hypothetical protein [Bacteroidales bacterium]